MKIGEFIQLFWKIKVCIPYILFQIKGGTLCNCISCCLAKLSILKSVN